MTPGYQEIKVAGGDTAMPLTMLKRLDFIGKNLRPGPATFLDCGCGRGDYVLALMERFGLDAHGIELREDKVRIAQAKPALAARVQRGDLEAIQQPDNAWDYLMLNEVLEHVPDDRKALAEVYRILKPGGRLFVFSPNRWFPFETHGVYLKSSQRRLPHWAPFIPYLPLPLGRLFFNYWARNYWQGELMNLLRGAGFSMVDRGYVWLTFEGISRNQPAIIRLTKPALRAISNQLEKFPFVKRFGVSQALVCEKK